MLRQTKKSWVSSPLGINVLLALYNKNNSKNLNKYIQINSILKYKDGIAVKNKIFYHQQYDATEGTNLPDFNGDKETINFEDLNKSASIINNWVKQFEDVKGFDIVKNISIETKAVFLNLLTFKGAFPASKNQMTRVYNSFNYTQDIQYEGRLLEFPMKNDFKLVILMPNDTDVLSSLYEKLIDDGFKAAVNSIRPIFIATTDIKAPQIAFVSDTELKLKKKIIEHNNMKASQWGTAKIYKNGVNLQVVTCLTFSENKFVPSISNEDSKANVQFYFAIIFKDTPIFTGQYVHE